MLLPFVLSLSLMFIVVPVPVDSTNVASLVGTYTARGYFDSLVYHLCCCWLIYDYHLCRCWLIYDYYLCVCWLIYAAKLKKMV